ncbi:TPA: GNAT family N-acetyltransferase, partial [Bacillus anthracis]|nr:GNAT family N-acetyltransferase [Bacillus anthracis]
MKILPYIDKYQNQVIALILYIQNYDTKVDLSLADQPDLLSIPEYYNATSGNFWVAVSDDDDVIGTIGLSVKENYGILKK